jgi:DNA helicase-2/ATP-dependent DNA helicase PcrA
VSILNVPNRYIGRKFIKDLEEYAVGEDKHLYEALETFTIDAPYLKKNVKEFQNLLDPLIKDADTLEPAETISMLRDALDYDSYITDDDIPTPDDQKVQNITQLHLAATRFKSIEQFIEYTDTFSDDSVNDKNGVRLMTIHKSKGMEYKIVFVVGLNENILPSKRGDIEEERRICFVAISRAMKHLYLSYYSSCLNGQKAVKSIFIDEILGKK